MITIRDMFINSTKSQQHCLQGYQIKKKYVHTHTQPSAQKKKLVLKRGSYLDNHYKIYKNIPGPDKYLTTNNFWTKKIKNNSLLIANKKKKKKTWVDQILQHQKKYKLPGPGAYQFSKSLSQWSQKKIVKQKTHSFPIRTTYLDSVQFDAIKTPGVGKYNARKRPLSCSFHHRLKTDRPQQRRKKDLIQSKKIRTRQLKTPDMGSYNPREVKSFTRKKTKQGSWDRDKRFSELKKVSTIGPGRYLQLQNWNNPNKTTNSFSSRPKSAYYN